MHLRFLLASLLLATGFAHAEPVTYKLAGGTIQIDPGTINIVSTSASGTGMSTTTITTGGAPLTASASMKGLPHFGKTPSSSSSPGVIDAADTTSVIPASVT